MTKTLLEEILEWSRGLPPWQSDAVARLLMKHLLPKSDEDDVLALLKAAHGIADSQNRIPKPLTEDQIPAHQSKTNRILINAIKDLRHVNAIAENQRLEFGASGITIIYGDNGSGKSGYSRVLKQACRARDRSEPIHPNFNLSADMHGVAQAAFEITVDDVSRDVQWNANSLAPSDLSSFAIFDSRCARAYLDSEDDFSYVPYGLDVFEGLGKLCKKLQEILESEQTQSKPDLTAYVHLHGDTSVGKLISSLSHTTKAKDVEKLASLNEQEIARYAQVTSGLKENNPKERAQVLRGRARRISGITDKLVELAKLVSKNNVAVLRRLCDEYRSANEAAAIAANKFNKAGNLLPGTGGEAWRELFEAARKFALESHPACSFPNLGSESLCPLCQEPLGKGSDRLLHFEEFLEKEAERVAKEKKEALSKVYKPLAAQKFDAGLDEVTFGELESIEPKLAQDVRAFELALNARHGVIMAAATANDWTGLETDLMNPSARLGDVVTQINEEAGTLEKAADDTARLALQHEFEELDARIRLSKSKQSVLSTIEKLIHGNRLTACIRALKTNAISSKAAELAEKVVSSDLAEALNREFSALGLTSLKVVLKSRTVRGKALHKLTLHMDQSKSPGEVLSEGEQRAIAIGSFLAEVNLSDGHAGVIFDDPMSSLDHKRRERIARRLVVESAKRQVIIFTHDIYFVCLLTEEANSQGVPALTQSITRRSAGVGVCDPELPFEGRTTSKRIGFLKQQQQLIAKLHRAGDEAEWAKQTVDVYFRLRMTWERAVEEVLFRSVVLRFRKGISTMLLSGVVVDDSDYSSVYEGMTKCSNYAHDKAMEGGVAFPDPTELLADIERLESWRASVETRSQATSKRRKT